MTIVHSKSKAEKPSSSAGGRMVKYKGIAVSTPPSLSADQVIFFNSRAFYVMVGISILPSIGLLTGFGEAGICHENADGFTFECSGPANSSNDKDISISPQEVVNKLIINTTEGFNHENTKSDESRGIVITDNGKVLSEVNYSDEHKSRIKASHFALEVQNESRSNLLIFSNGEFHSENNIGASIRNNGIANVDIKLHKVTGKESGLFLRNTESVSSKITTTGEIQGKNHAGILTLAEGGELTLTANGKVLGRSGISSIGFTDSIITTTDDVIGTEIEGIFSNVTSAGSDLTINAHNVTGALRGILANNYGKGNTNITVTGLVKGETEHGIWAAHNGNDLNIQVNDTTARIHGIHITDTISNGDINVISTGTIKAGETGVYMNLDSLSYDSLINVIDIISGHQGIYAKHQGSGNISVAVSGNVEVKPDEFPLFSTPPEGETRCVTAKDNNQCGVVEIDTQGDARIDVSGNIKARESISTPQIVVDLTGVERSASVIIREAGRIYGQTVTRTENSDAGLEELDELVFLGDNVSHRLNLADIGNKNSEFAFIGFDILTKRGHEKLSLNGKQSNDAFHSAEFYAGETYFNDISLLLKDQTSIARLFHEAKISITGTTGSDITGSVINDGTISLKASSNVSDHHIFNIGGSLTNTGTISMNDDFIGNQIVVQGNYIATDSDISKNVSRLILDVTLNDDGSPTDKLIIHGHSTGHTAVEVVSSIKPGAKTLEGIPIIEISGFSNGTFALNIGDYQTEAGEWKLIGGAYSYGLERSGKNWHLTSYETSGSSKNQDTIDPAKPKTPTIPKPEEETDKTEKILENPKPEKPIEPNPPEAPKPDAISPKKRTLQPAVPVAMAANEHFLFLNRFSSLHERAGSRHDELFKSALHAGLLSTSWVSIDDSRANNDEKTIESKNNHNATKLGFGVDFGLQPDEVRYVIGFNGYTKKSGVSSKSKSGYGNINSQSYGIGVTGTAYIKESYIDMQAKYHQLSSDFVSQELGIISQNQKGDGYAFSVEGGHKIKGGAQWNLIPQAQLSYSSTSVDPFDDFKHNRFEFGDTDQMTLRIGAALDHKISGGKGETYIYSKADIYHELMDAPSIKIAGTKFVSNTEDTRAELIMGGEYRIKNTAARLYGEVRIASDIGSLADITKSGINFGTNISW